MICSDYWVRSSELLAASSQLKAEDVLSAEQTIAASDLLVIGVPHSDYQTLDYQNKPVIDIWNSLGRGSVI